MPSFDVPSKRRLGFFSPARSALDVARDEVRSMDEASARTRFGVSAACRALKSTVSLCPVCLSHVPALVFERSGRVWIAKECVMHGFGEAVLENDARFYFLSNKDKTGRIFAHDRVFDIPTFSPAGAAEGCCDGAGGCDGTDQLANKTCTILVEVTDACNLACRVCYSDAKGDRILPLASFRAHLETLIAKKGGLDSVQLTGGEAMLHPDFWQMLDFVAEHPKIKKVYLPTNGLLLAGKGDRTRGHVAATRLARHASKLMVLLQFDGVSDDADEQLRDATPARARAEVVARLGALGVPMQLTMTLAKGVNLHEVGDVIELALRHDHVKVVAIQPATYSGRYDLEPSPTERLTLSDVVKAIGLQTRRRARESDFVPIPCSHPNCGWITLYLRRFGFVRNVVRYVDLPRVMDAVAYRTLLSTTELRDAVGTSRGGVVRRALGRIVRRIVRSEDMFTVAIKPFMDRHSYDQDRVDNCCHHLMDTSGTPRSFCEYNAILRQRDSWADLPRI